MEEGEDIWKLKILKCCEFSKILSRYFLNFLDLYCIFFGLDLAMGSNVKVDFEKFDGKNFFIWKVRVEDFLVQAELDQVLEENPEGMSDCQWMSLEKKACSIIRECLVDVALYSVLEERTPGGL